jgi:hypothetical protein
MAAGLVAAGCGAGVTADQVQRVDTAEVELLLVQKQKERSPNLRVGQAACPGDVRALAGESFECTLEIEGTPVRFRVKLTEIVGREARYEIRPTKPIVDVVGLAAFLRSRLEEDWRAAAIDCGRFKVRVVDIGSSLDCLISNGREIRVVEAVVEDLDGSVTLREKGVG